MGIFRGKNAKLLTMMTAIAVVIVLFYVALTKKEEEKNSQLTVEAATEVATLMDKDLDKEYPASVREVVKLYLRIITCYYNEDLEEKELVTLIDQQRALFDKEFLDHNKYGDFKKRLENEISSYKSANKTVINYQINSNQSVQYWWNNGKECASIMVVVNLNGKSLNQVYEKFILRKNDNGKWKILGWQLADEDDFKSPAPAKTIAPQSSK